MIRFFITSALILGLSACSLFDTKTPQQELATTTQFDWQQTQQKLRQLKHWRIVGKIGVRTPTDSLTAAINQWSQSNDNYSLELSSTFFGLGASKLYGNANFLTIVESGEDPVSSYQPNELIEAALGFPLPITHLPLWVKALPDDSQHYEIEFNEQGLPATLKQHEWQLQFSKYTSEQGIPLPGKIKLQREGTRIILAIKQWTVL